MGKEEVDDLRRRLVNHGTEPREVRAGPGPATAAASAAAAPNRKKCRGYPLETHTCLPFAGHDLVFQAFCKAQVGNALVIFIQLEGQDRTRAVTSCRDQARSASSSLTRAHPKPQPLSSSTTSLILLPNLSLKTSTIVNNRLVSATR